MTKETQTPKHETPNGATDSELTEALRQLGTTLAGCDKLQDGLAACLSAAFTATSADGGIIYFYNNINRSLNLASHSGLSDRFVEEVSFLGPDTPNTQLIASKQVAYLDKDFIIQSSMKYLSEEGIQSIAAVPILSHRNLIAALVVSSRTNPSFSTREQLAIEAISRQIGNAIVRLQLAEQLAQREQQYRLLLQNSNDIIQILEIQHDKTPLLKILEASQATYEFFGCGEEDVHKFDLMSAVAPHHKELVEQQVQKLLEGKDVSYEVDAIRHDGCLRRLDICGKLIYINERPIAISIARDITVRRDHELALAQSEQELRKLAARISTAAETERQVVAEQLHDGIAQTVTGLRFSISALLNELPANSRNDIPQRIKTALDNLGDITGKVRDIIAELRPPALEHFGLMDALENYAQRLKTQYPIEITFCSPNDDPPLPAGASLSLYRIGQDAISNTCLHAEATELHLKMKVSDTTMHFSITDNGKGFDPDQSIPYDGRNHLGLVTMKERATSIGATLNIDTAPGTGTRISVSLELSPEK